MNVQFVDVQVSGRIARRAGVKLAPEVTVKESTGHVWVNNKRCASLAGTREILAVQNRMGGPRVTQLEFARDLAPQAMDGYLNQDGKGLVKDSRLPATGDPISICNRRLAGVVRAAGPGRRGSATLQD